MESSSTLKDPKIDFTHQGLCWRDLYSCYDTYSVVPALLVNILFVYTIRNTKQKSSSPQSLMGSQNSKVTENRARNYGREWSPSTTNRSQQATRLHL